MRTIHALVAAGALAAALPAFAEGFHDPSGIDRDVAQFTGAPTGSAGGARLPVDRRLKLSRCPMPLALEWYGSTGQTVLVRCPIAGGWRLFVPIAGLPAGATPEPVVTRGEVVAIVIQGRGFTVTHQGEALEAGAVDEWIRVRPAGAKRDTVRARVLQPGKVALGLP